MRQAKLVNPQIQTTNNALGYLGTTPSVSGLSGTIGVTWALEDSGPAILHAYDATNLSNDLHNSAQAKNGRDA